MPKIHELPDGSLAAYFDADGNMIDDADKAETARIIKPDGSLVFAARSKEKPDETQS